MDRIWTLRVWYTVLAGMPIVTFPRLFAILADPENEILAHSIPIHFPNNYMEIRPGQWFVVAPGTAQEISETLQITTGVSGSAVIVSVSGYYGLASTQIWEWLASKIGKPVHA